MFVVTDRRDAGTTWLAALAAGLGIGTKLTLLAPVGVLAVACVVIAGRGRRVATALRWGGGLAIGGAFWFVRNLVHAGNPVPSIHIPGLPSPRDPFLEKVGFSVFHYLGDGAVLRGFRVGLGNAFGPTWWVMLAIVGAAIAAVLLTRSEGGVLRVLGVVGAVSFVVYLITPTSAQGPEGHPTLFVANTCDALPALAVGLVLLPLLPALRRDPWRLLTVAGLGLLTLAEVASRTGRPPTYRLLGVLVVVGAVAGVAVLAVLRSRTDQSTWRRLEVAMSVVGAIAVLVGGVAYARTYATTAMRETIVRRRRPPPWPSACTTSELGSPASSSRTRSSAVI